MLEAEIDQETVGVLFWWSVYRRAVHTQVVLLI
jgi:hypothetical protein